MEKEKASQKSFEKSVEDSEGLAKIKAQLETISAAQTRSNSLASNIEEYANTAAAKKDDIEQMWLLAERAKSELDSQIVPLRDAAATVHQQAEAAKANVNEMKALVETLQAKNAQASDASNEAIKTLESLRALADAASEHARTATAKSEEIEAKRADAETVKTEMASQLATTREAIAAFNQQMDAAKASIAELNGLSASLQTTSNQAKDASVQATAALESLRTLTGTASESAGRIEALKAKVEEAAQVAAQRSQHIEDGREYVDKKRAEIDVILNTAQQSASNTEAQHQAGQATIEKLNILHAAMQTTKASVDSDAVGVERLRQQCEAHSAIAKKLADTALITEQKIAQYESRLAEFEQAAAERLKTIEGLLPGAASAGLASAFNLRRQDFKWRPRLWQAAFILSILGLLGLAALELYTRAATALTWDDILLSLVHRLPFALPLIWLAFHSSHKAALAERIEEDYGFKETVSRLFEGYRREMAELEGKVTAGSALELLCTEILAVITNPPGRIYEKHRLNSTPITAIAASARPIADAASKVVKPL